MSILDRELGDQEFEEGSHLHPDGQPEVIEGVDPFTDDASEGTFQRLEMQERKGLRMPPSSVHSSVDLEGSIDPGHVVQDSHVAEESGAVKQVELE